MRRVMYSLCIVCVPNRARARRELLTARESSIGSSGGTTDVMISAHSSSSL